MRLERYQRRLADALLADDPAMPEGLFVDGPRNELAWRVYRNNVHFSLMTTLSEAFPVVNRLLGDDAFAALAQAHLRQHPPVSAVLAEFGHDFPDFLRAHLDQVLAGFVPDVAQLDWLYLRAQHAADAHPLDPQVLAGLGMDALPQLRLQLHPSVQTFHSPIPAFSIWQSNKRGQRRQIRLDAGAEAALLLRHADAVHVLPLAPEACAAVAALATGRSIAHAFAQLPDDTTTATLSSLFQYGAITDYFIPSEPPQ